MGANPRTKGGRGEREVQAIFNTIVAEVREELGLPEYEKDDMIFQRNQNQSAVGGDDLTNPCKLSIEVKNQNNLSTGVWWKQCTTSADRPAGGIPILIYKISRKGWHIVMEPEAWYAAFPGEEHFPYPDDKDMKGASRLQGVVRIRQPLLELWFRNYYKQRIQSGEFEL